MFSVSNSRVAYDTQFSSLYISYRYISLYFPPHLSPASLTALQPLSSLGQGSAVGTSQSQEHVVRASRECSRGQLTVGFGREKVIKAYPRGSQLADEEQVSCGVQHRAMSATVTQCRCFAFVALWAMPAWFCFIICQIKVPKGWQLPFCTPPCLAVRQGSGMCFTCPAVSVLGVARQWQPSLVLAAASVICSELCSS